MGLKQKAIEAMGEFTPSEFAALHPGQHVWFVESSWSMCAICGVVKRKNAENKPCKGPVRVELRS